MPQSEYISVCVVDDDDRIRAGLELIIDDTPLMCCAGAFADAEALLSSKILTSADVVLLDIGLPGMSGIDAIPTIRKKSRTLNIIMLTVHEENDLIFNALCEGASGYLLKNTPPAQIIDAIREVRAGGAPMTASVARKVVHFFRQPEISYDSLTERENEVLQHLVDGETNRQIAEKLFISENTVAYHIKQIYEKLHVHSRTEAVTKAMRRGHGSGGGLSS